MIGAVIIKHKLCLSDMETVQQIQENPYLQYFVGLPGYQQAEPFAPSLFVDIRKRKGAAVFAAFHRAVIDAHEGEKKKRQPGPPQQPHHPKAWMSSLRLSQRHRRLSQLNRPRKANWVIQQLYQQRWEMYQAQARRCDHRIVSISQPYVRPIVRGKQDKPVEFGAKLSVSLTGDGLAHVDHLRWDAFHEGLDLVSQVEAYRNRHGHYPERVLADPLYGTRANRDDLKQRGIHFAGKPLGRPKQMTDANREQLKQQKAQRRNDYLQLIPIEGKFGQGKNGYRLNYIRAKRADTSFAWINSIFLVMNLLILQRIFFALGKIGYAGFIELFKQARKWLFSSSLQVRPV